MSYLYNLFPFLHSSLVDKISIGVLIIITLYVFNYILKESARRYVKIFLFHRKDKHPLFKLLFKRYDYLLKPIRLFINIYFYKVLINLFIISNIISEIFSILYLILTIWFIYELIKLFLYAVLIRKIYKAKNARRELINLFLNITKVLIVLVVIVIILAKVGVDVTALVTSLGIGGAILALSAKDTLTNFFDSLRLISSNAFSQGDWVQTKELDGFVTEVGLITTKIRTFENALVTVPNSKLANDYIKNWSRRMVGRKIKFHIRLKIKNNEDEIDSVIQDILLMLNNHKDIVNDEKIKKLIKLNHTYEDGLFNIADKYGVRKTMLVYLDKIDIYSMDILVYVFSVSVDWKEWLQTKQDILKKVINIIDKSSLEFAYPKEEILIEREDTKK